jgi:hypothetical protein
VNTLRFLFFWKEEILKFWWHSKVPRINNLWAKFGKIWLFWAVLGRFCSIVVAESMPNVRLKSLKPSNSWIVNPIATWRVLLESYHPCLWLQKVSKNPQMFCIFSNLSKNAKSHFGFLGPLGVNAFPKSM